MQNCPGINKGLFNLDKEEILAIRKQGLENTGRDVLAYEKYLVDNNLKRKESETPKDKLKEIKDINVAIQEFENKWRDSYFFGKTSGPHLKGKRFVEPLAELGMIPRHPFLKIWNDNLNH